MSPDQGECFLARSMGQILLNIVVTPCRAQKFVKAFTFIDSQDVAS